MQNSGLDKKTDLQDIDDKKTPDVIAIPLFVNNRLGNYDYTAIPTKAIQLRDPLKPAIIGSLDNYLDKISNKKISEKGMTALNLIKGQLVILKKSCEEKNWTEWVSYLDELIQKIENLIH